MEVGRCITVPVVELQFINGGNTIWVHGPDGATVLRIKTKGQITVNRECENVCSHCDLMVDGDIEFCVVPADLVPGDRRNFAQGCLFACVLLALAALGILAVAWLHGS